MPFKLQKIVMKCLINFSLLPLLCINLFASQNVKKINMLELQIDTINKKIESLQVKNKGALELKNRDSVLSIGGRIQLHAIFSSPEYSSFNLAKIPITKSGEQNQLNTSARESRFWIKTRTPSEYGLISTLIELDFLGSKGTETTTNSHNPRLRHAYFNINGFTIGQTNSTFNPLVTLDTISYAVNTLFVRQPLIRYSIKDEKIIYDFSFEQPETTLLNSSGEIVTPKDDLLPDFILRARYYPKWGNASISLLARYLKQDLLEVGTRKDSAFAWGANISAKIKLLELDDFRFSAQYGQGLGRYMAYNAYPSATLNKNGKINPQTSYGIQAGYKHWWSTKLKSTFALSYIASENNKEDLLTEDVNKEAYSIQVNLFWTPAKNTLFGVEYADVKRTMLSEESGNSNMLIILSRYNF